MSRASTKRIPRAGFVDNVAEPALVFSFALFRPLLFRDVAALGNQKLNFAAVVCNGFQRKIDGVNLSVRRRMGCLETHEFSRSGVLDRGAQSILHLLGMGPPRRLPKRLPKGVRLRDAGELQRRSIGLDKCAVRRHQADELEGPVENGAVLGFEIELRIIPMESLFDRRAIRDVAPFFRHVPAPSRDSIVLTLGKQMSGALFCRRTCSPRLFAISGKTRRANSPAKRVHTTFLF